MISALCSSPPKSEAMYARQGADLGRATSEPQQQGHRLRECSDGRCTGSRWRCFLLPNGCANCFLLEEPQGRPRGPQQRPSSSLFVVTQIAGLGGKALIQQNKRRPSSGQARAVLIVRAACGVVMAGNPPQYGVVMAGAPTLWSGHGRGPPHWSGHGRGPPQCGVVMAGSTLRAPPRGRQWLPLFPPLQTKCAVRGEALLVGMFPPSAHPPWGAGQDTQSSLCPHQHLPSMGLDLREHSRRRSLWIWGGITN